MKEIVRNDSCALTDTLDPLGKPYLVLDQNSQQYHVLYWRAWFLPGGRWIASDWYDNPDAKREDEPSRKAKGWPKPLRIWELPDVEYAPPVNYTKVTVL